MTDVIKIIDDQPLQYSMEQFRSDNKSTAFGASVSDALLATHGVYRVRQAVKPSCSITQRAVLKAVPENINGIWVRGWEIFNLDIDTASDAVRQERNNLLSASDWTQVSDAPVDQAAWSAYRESLRNIPLQAGFPLDVAWPVKPE